MQNLTQHFGITSDSLRVKMRKEPHSWADINLCSQKIKLNVRIIVLHSSDSVTQFI